MYDVMRLCLAGVDVVPDAAAQVAKCGPFDIGAAAVYFHNAAVAVEYVARIVADCSPALVCLDYSARVRLVYVIITYIESFCIYKIYNHNAVIF